VSTLSKSRNAQAAMSVLFHVDADAALVVMAIPDTTGTMYLLAGDKRRLMPWFRD